jgi:ABC-type Zn uptake system ZnuABC Zn-binding protein ZnuA
LREGNAPVTIRVFEVPVRLAWAVVVAVIALLLAVGCGENGDGAPASPAGDDRPPPEVTVVTTLPIFADFVRVAGGDRVEVFVMLPDGLDPELLELPPEDVERIGEADLILYNGLDLEMTVEDLLFDHKRRGSQIVAYSKDIESPTREGMLAFAARDNPYLWLDPVLAITYVDTSWDSLVIVDGEAKSTYQANANEYKEQLRSLHNEVEETLASIPPENRKLVAFDDSFFHLANRYGLEPVRLATPVSTDEPSPRRVVEWAELLSDQGAPAVFAEAGFTSDLLRQAARRAGVEVCTLYGDHLDDEVTTYLEMMRFNVDELARCLGGG